MSLDMLDWLLNDMWSLLRGFSSMSYDFSKRMKQRIYQFNINDVVAYYIMFKFLSLKISLKVKHLKQRSNKTS